MWTPHHICAQLLGLFTLGIIVVVSGEWGLIVDNIETAINEDAEIEN